MATVSTLINAAMMDIGAVASGEAAQASEQADALVALNNLLDSYSTENLIIFNKVIETFSLIGGQQSYTIGTGGNFSTVRPINIEEAGILVTQGSQNVEIPMDIITKDEWAAIQVKSTTSPIPMKLYNDSGYPFSTLYFWPLPSAANSVVLYSWKPLTDFATISTTISLPPGYNRLLQKGLAIELAPMFGKEVSQVLAAQYREAKSNVKRMNKTPMFLGTDAALLGPKPGFNWLTGDTIG